MATSKKTGKDEATVDAKAGGAAAGGTAGAVIGGLVGGPVGAGVGAVAGAAAGGMAGSAVEYESVEPEFRRHWESGEYAKSHEWEQAAPAYRYGFEHAGKGDHGGRSFDEVRQDLKSKWRHKGHFEDVEPMVRAGWERRAQATLDAGGEAVVPVVEEQLQVGKRTVEKGGVKVQTKVTETPVEETVHLHEEHVKVQRRPANRKATAADTSAALTEGTLELRETAEEAVVAKTARVIEEVVISKEASDRAETVRDTVKRTDVDVQKTAGHAQVTGETHAVKTAGFDTFANDFRTDFGTRFGNRGYTYEQVTPAYRFGHDLASSGRFGTDWTTVEPEAHRLWEERNHGTWADFKDAVHHAWQKVTGQR